MKVLIFSTHPIQYQAPIYRALANKYDLKVYFLLNQTSEGHAKSGFGVSFEWDIPLTDGYAFDYMKNLSKSPSSSQYEGIVLDINEIKLIYERDKPDIVFVNGWFPKGLKQIARYFKRKGIPVICRGDSNLLMTKNRIKKSLKEIYIRWILRDFDFFLYVGKANKDFYLHYGVDESCLFPAFHCINTPLFRQQYLVAKKNPSQKIRVGFAGKLIDKKQPLLLLEAINLSSFKNEIQLVVVGDGPLRKELIEAAELKGVDIDFIGFLNQSEIVLKGYSNFDVLVLPSSNNETWGLVVNELMTNGIPAIVSDSVGCYPDLIENGKTGFVFKNGSVNELTSVIDRFIQLKKEKFDFDTPVKEKINKYSLDSTVKGYSQFIEHYSSKHL